MKHKHGDNCPRCKEIKRRLQDQKKQHIRLVADLRLILATTGYIKVEERIWKRLDGEDAC